ncbi:MAG: PQQ-binding-like beta-propeller repeat protein [Anditalea sp.]
MACKNHAAPHSEAGKDWPVYLGGKSSAQYSPLDQINPQNVDQLEVAWVYQTGDADSTGKTQIQCNPIVVDGIMYGSSPKLKIFAINAATGKNLWEFDPKKIMDFGLGANRGVTYWQEGEDKRILFTAGSHLFCLNAESGQLMEGFGDNGKVSLKSGLGERANELYVTASSPGIIFNDKLIIGSRVSENDDAAPGYIRAFNVVSGKLEWVFHTIPKPGEFGHETWPEDSFLHAGGANSWAGMSLDEDRGIVYVPTGSASFDFWGGKRHGENLFANSVLALNAENGNRIWHFQTVHHDLWDRDLPAPGNLVRIEQEGRKVDALAQITKSGFVFLFDRETGEPLFPIEEKPVPASDLVGEQTWATQPFPVKPPPFVRQRFTDEDITNISPAAKQYVTDKLTSLRKGDMFTPPSTQGTIIFPGFDGGGEWGGAAFDETSGLLYVNANEMPWILTMVSTDSVENGIIDQGKTAYISHCGTCHGLDLNGDPSGAYPGLAAIDKEYDQEEILEIINKGRGRMPALQHLEEGTKKAIMNYISGIENKGGAHPSVLDSPTMKVPYTHTGYNRFMDEEGYPAVKPPWGTLAAIDLNAGKIAWKVPLGEFSELTAKGIPPTGTENYGGPVVTAGGLVFIGASKDEYFRAFDKLSGKELWKYKLPAGGYATPAVYEVDGRQYVVIAAGGGKMGTPSGDSYLAFALKR